MSQQLIKAENVFSRFPILYYPRSAEASICSRPLSFFQSTCSITKVNGSSSLRQDADNAVDIVIERSVVVMKQSGFHFEDGQVCTGLQLYWACHSLALQARKRFHGYQLLPSGARIFYYTRRLLLAEGLPEIHPDETLLPALAIERFLQAASLVAEHVAVEFARAVRLRAEPGPELKRLLSGTLLRRVPAPPCLPEEHLDRSDGRIQQRWEQLWEASWREAEQEHLARLWVWIHGDRLSVLPVAGALASPHIALYLLQAQLAKDAERGWQIPSDGAYLYQEPLEEWLLRPLLAGRWFYQLCQALAELSSQVSV